MELVTLKDCLAQEDNSDVSGVYVMLTAKSTLETATGKNYLNLTVQDRSTSHSFKNFFNTDADFEMQNANLEEGKIYQIFSKIGSYNGSKQIKNARFRPVKAADYEQARSYVLPVYSFEHVHVDTFKEFIDEYITEPNYNAFVKAALGNFQQESKVWIDFLTAPAAKSHHGNKIHGLFYHTLAVARNCQSIVERYEDGKTMPYQLSTVNLSRLLTAAILHDIMKTEEYEWEEGIKIRRDIYLKHIERGIVFLYKINEQAKNPLSEQELDFIQYAILSHHGDFGPYKPLHIEHWILHLADMIDAKVVYEIENQ